MAENPFVGSWRLESFELRKSNGQVSFPFGKDAHGYIIYNPDSHMSVAFMRTGRPNFASEELFSGTPEEKGLAYDTYFSYSGTYEIRGDQVIHHIEVSMFPNWTGHDQARFYRFEGDLLILSTPPLPVDGLQQTGYLIWKKSQKA